MAQGRAIERQSTAPSESRPVGASPGPSGSKAFRRAYCIVTMPGARAGLGRMASRALARGTLTGGISRQDPASNDSDLHALSEHNIVLCI